MIAVIMVIILAVKGSLGYCVFALLPCSGSGLHNHHPSRAWDQRYPFRVGNVADVLNTPKQMFCLPSVCQSYNFSP